MSDEKIKVWFEASINLTPEEIMEADGSLEQAVQNQIGHTGAVVEEANEL